LRKVEERSPYIDGVVADIASSGEKKCVCERILGSRREVRKDRMDMRRGICLRGRVENEKRKEGRMRREKRGE
jgi:hypothetical protein